MRSYSSPLSTTDLLRVFRAHPVLSAVHVGVFPRDALADLTVHGRPRHLVFNVTASYEDDGAVGHWLSIWLGEDTRAELVDSLGMKPVHPEVLSFLRRHASTAVYTSRRLQDWSSNCCGLYCQSHALARARGHSLESWLAQFTSCPSQNDRRIECQFMHELAFPALFSPPIRAWQSAVARACRPAGTCKRTS